LPDVPRLHALGRIAAPPPANTRNVFAFLQRAATPDTLAAKALPPLVAPETVLPGPSLKLIGLAEASAADAAARIAIVTTGTELFLVREGDEVASRYRVTSIMMDSAELEDLRGGPAVRLACNDTAPFAGLSPKGTCVGAPAAR
jgi:hypothetical protein